MIIAITSLWEYLSNIGTNQKLSEQENRRIKITMQLHLLLLFIMIARLVINLLLHSKNATNDNIVILIVIAFLNIFLLKQGFIKLCKLSLSIFTLFFLLIYPVIFREPFEKYYLWFPSAALAFTIVPHIIFSYKKEFGALMFAIIYCFFCLFLSEILIKHFSHNQFYISKVFSENFLALKFNQLAIFSFINLAFIYYHRLTSRYETILESNLQVIKEQKEELGTANEEIIVTNEELNKKNEILENYKTELEIKVEERTKELKTNEARYKSIFENANDAILIMDRELIIDCNSKALDIFGCDKSEIIGQTPIKFSPEIQPDGELSEQKAINKISFCYKGIPQRFEWRHKRLDNIEFDADITLNKILIGQDELLQAIVRDISDFKQSELSLKNTKIQLKTLLNTIPDLIWLKNPYGVYLQCNERFEAFFGANETDIIGKTDYDFVEQEQAYSFRQNDSIAINAGKPSINVEEVTFADGHKEILETIKTPIYGNKGKIEGILGIGRNITKRQQTESQLLESQAKLSSIIESTDDMIWAVNIKDYSLLSFNSALVLFFKTVVDFDIKIGDLLNDILPTETANLWKDFYDKTVKDGSFETEFEVHKNKNTIHLTFNLLKKNGDIFGISVFGKNITERKQIEQKVHESESMLRAMFEASRDAISVSKEGLFVYGNKSYLNLFGFENAEKLVDTSTFDNFAPSRREEMLKRTQQKISVDSKKPFFTELCVKTDGTEFFAEFNVSSYELNNEIYSVASIRDITERIGAENSLRLSEDKFSKAFNASPIPIAITDFNTGKFIEINDSFLKFFECTSNELMNSSTLKLGIWESESQRAEILKEIGEHKSNKFNDIVFNKKNNASIAVNYYAELIEYNNTKCILSIFEDLTLAKETERKILNAKIEAEERERAYFANELHDGIGPLLSTIRLYIQWLNKPKMKASKEEIIQLADKTVQDTIVAIKEISHKLTPNVLKTFGLITAVNSFIDRIKNTVTISIVFNSNLENRIDEHIEVTLYRLIIECINNTLKHANASEIILEIIESNQDILVEYRDNGIGFDFEKTLKTGKGLGLFNMENRIKILGGNFAIKSSEGNGVKINVKIKL